MKDSAEAIHAINAAATTKVQSAIGGTIANGTIAGGSVATANDPQVLGNFLATHYIGVLTYSEVIALIGAVWVLLQIIKTIVPFIVQIVRSVMPKKPVKPNVVTTTTSPTKVKKPKSTKAPA